MEPGSGSQVMSEADSENQTGQISIGNGVPKIIANGERASPSKSTFEIPEVAVKKKLLMYEIDDEPPWYLTLFLGFQHYLTMVGSTISVPFIITPLMCMVDDDPDKARLISTLIFVSGIVTVLQSTFGTRLPIIQGSSFSFIVPSLAILGLPRWKCPDSLEGFNDAQRRELWQERMRELQGAIIVSSLVEVLLGFFGIVGIILKYITPMTVAPAIAMIGLSLFHVSALRASSNWWISGTTMILIILFSQYIKDFKIPLPFTKSAKRNGPRRYPIFQVFPVLITIAIAWLACYVLTVTDTFAPGNAARTDIKSNIIRQSDWFRVPWPFQWGWPTVTAGAVFGMMSGVITGVVESIGDYMACARISGAKPPPTHAMNRGIFVEGIGCVLAGIWGTGNGTTSFSENIGAISVTKVGSRRVIQAAGILMITFAMVGKVGAVFISIPEPIVGGLFCIVFGTVTAVGLSNLQGVDLNSPRNIFVIGFSIFFGLTVSQWMEANKNVIQTGSDSIDQIITILLSTGMFVSGLLGFIFDNTIPGTPEERGLAAHAHSTHSIPLSVSNGTLDDDLEDISARSDKTYDFPFGMGLIRRTECLRRLPISPTYRGSVFGKLTLPTFLKNRKSVTISENS